MRAEPRCLHQGYGSSLRHFSQYETILNVHQKSNISRDERDAISAVDDSRRGCHCGNPCQQSLAADRMGKRKERVVYLKCV